MLNFEIENEFLKKLKKINGLVAGIDEVGRGALAGPVIAVSIIILNCFIAQNLVEIINDSKKISKKKRKFIHENLLKTKAFIGVGIVDNNIIDKVNILNATFMAMEKSLLGLEKQPDAVLIDGDKIPKNIKIPAISVIKGDGKSLSIASASIIAKVTRDKIMADLSKEYPMYEWEKNSGYGTKHHYEMIEKYGITPYHRKSFKLSQQSNLLNNQSQYSFQSLLQ